MPWNYGSNTGGAGTYNPGAYTGPGAGSPDYEWWRNNGMVPWDYEQATFDPNNWNGRTMVNPSTGETFAITPGMEIANQWGQIGDWDRALAAHGWLSPGSYKGIQIGGQSFASRDSQGNLVFNPGAMGGMFGSMNAQSGGGGGYDFTDYPEFTPYTPGEIPQVDPYQVSDFAQNIVDTNAVINAALPGIYEQQEKGFANAALRAGESGMAMSTPYAEALGEVSRKSGLDIAALTEQYRYNASEALAERRMQEELQQRALEQASWEAQQQLNMQAQMFNQQNLFNAWQAQNEYGQNRWELENTLGMQDYWNNRELTQEQQLQMQQAQAALMAQMMGAVMGQVPQGIGGMP